MAVTICGRCNEIKVRQAGQPIRIILRCADPASPLFTQEVTSEMCAQCVRHAEAQQPLHSLEVTKVDDGGPPPPTPGLLRRGLSWTAAVGGWVSAGRVERSDEEVQRIYNEFCANMVKPCSWFDPVRQICKGCGCNVKATGPAILNKIKMATQHCPRKLW